MQIPAHFCVQFNSDGHWVVILKGVEEKLAVSRRQ